MGPRLLRLTDNLFSFPLSSMIGLRGLQGLHFSLFPSLSTIFGLLFSAPSVVIAQIRGHIAGSSPRSQLRCAPCICFTDPQPRRQLQIVRGPFFLATPQARFCRHSHRALMFATFSLANLLTRCPARNCRLFWCLPLVFASGVCLWCLPLVLAAGRSSESGSW